MEIEEEITAKEEQMLQRLQRKKQKIESQRSSSIKKSYPMFQDPQSYQEQKDNDSINFTPIRLLPKFQSLSPESSKLSQGSVQPNSRSSPSPTPTNLIQAHQDDTINTLMAQVTSLAKIVQSLQAPQSNPIHLKEPPTIMNSQARTEIERLKQAVKSLNEPKKFFLPKIHLMIYQEYLCHQIVLLISENTMEPQTLFIISKLSRWKQDHTLKIDKF